MFLWVGGIVLESTMSHIKALLLAGNFPPAAATFVLTLQAIQCNKVSAVSMPNVAYQLQLPMSGEICSASVFPRPPQSLLVSLGLGEGGGGGRRRRRRRRRFDAPQSAFTESRDVMKILFGGLNFCLGSLNWHNGMSGLDIIFPILTLCNNVQGLSPLADHATTWNRTGLGDVLFQSWYIHYSDFGGRITGFFCTRESIISRNRRKCHIAKILGGGREVELQCMYVGGQERERARFICHAILYLLSP